MTGKENRQGLFRIGSVMVFTLLLMIGLAVCFDTYYDLNDDTVMKDIISGTYTGTPSGYSIQMLYPLSYLIAVLYTAIPGVPWYGLFLYLCQFGALVVIAWRLTGLVKSKKLQAGMLIVEAVVAAAMLFRNFVYVQYSVTSGLCMAAAIFWYIVGEEEENWIAGLKQNAVAVVLVWCAFCIRTELCIMLFPFLLLAGLVRWLSEEKIFTMENVKKYISLIVVALVGMVLCYTIDVCAYSSAEWEDFRDFFDARTDLYDFYGIPSYEEHQEFFEEAGLSQESYTLLQNYNFSLDEEINTELMQNLAEYQTEQAKQGENLYWIAGMVFKNAPKQAVWLYKEYLLKQVPYLIIAAYVLYFLLAFLRKKSGCYWKILLLFGVRSILWMYLFMAERIPERITTPLECAELMVLIGWIVQEVRVQSATAVMKERAQHGYIYMKQMGTVLLLGFCGVMTFVITVEQTGQEYMRRIEANQRWEALISYCKEHQENYYSVDVYSSTSYQGDIYSEKIFKEVDNSYRNFDVCGGWVAKSPLMYEKLEKSGIENLERAFLLEEDNVFFVAACDKDINWLREYYTEKGYEIEIEVIDTIYADVEEAFYVYDLRTIN